MNTDGKRSSFRILAHSKDAKLRLFCFPHAGAGVAPYFAWAKLLSSDIEVVGIQLPGRENRISEPPLSSIDDVVSMLAIELEDFLDLPFAFFGHSMGALIAFELIRHARRQGRPEPMHLFVSGRAAPNWPVPRIHELPTAELLDYIRSFNGTASEILESPEMVSIFLPVLKADFSVCASRVHHPEPPLTCPITAFGGDRDRSATPEMIADWKQQTPSTFHMSIFPGTHFFVLMLALQVSRVVEQQLKSRFVMAQKFQDA
jgi:surfactin synthase thioesterase subunit